MPRVPRRPARRKGTSTLLVFLANDDDAPRVRRKQPAPQQRPLPPPPSIRDEGFDAEAPTGGNETSSFEGALRDLARRVAEQARRAADDEDLDGRGREYLSALEEALSDEGLVKALADQCAPLLDDPGVAVHVALSVGTAGQRRRATRSPPDGLEATLDARPPSQPSGPSLRVPASLMRWMGLRPREETTPPPQKKSDDEDPAKPSRKPWTMWSWDRRSPPSRLPSGRLG